MKKIISFLFNQPANKNIPRPIFILLFVAFLVGYLIFQFGGSKDETNAIEPVTTPTGTTQKIENEDNLFSGLLDKIMFWKKDENALAAPLKNEFVPPPIPDVPSDMLSVDEILLNKADSLMGEKFAVSEISLDNMGKKDPMKPISNHDNSNVSKDIAKFNPNKVDRRTADMKNESKYYYDGMTFNNLMLNSIQVDENNRVTGTFIGMGGTYTVHEGEFLAGVYYIKSINQSTQKATLVYENKNYELKVQNLVNPMPEK